MAKSARALRAASDNLLVVDFRGKSKNEFFWAKVDKSAGPDACWPWLGTVDHGNGYGRAWGMEGRPYAHRKAWELHNGRKAPAGKFVLHRCVGNKLCCQPGHLYIGDAKKNAADAVAQGRMTGPKLTVKEARAIVVMRFPNFPDMTIEVGKVPTYTAIAKRFGVSNQTVFRICKGMTWAHVTGIGSTQMSLPLEIAA